MWADGLRRRAVYKEDPLHFGDVGVGERPGLSGCGISDLELGELTSWLLC